MDNINDNINLHNIIDTIEDHYKAKKVKESSLLLKQKMCKTHDLIKQYTEKVREVDYLKSERNLEITNKDTNYMKSMYKSVIDKTRKLELQILEDKSKNEKLSNQIKEYDVNKAADKQVIQQLTCKIKELEDDCSAKIIEYDLQKSSLKDKIKDLQYELRKLKVNDKKKEKRIIPKSDTAKLSLDTKSSSDIGINVSLCDNELNAKPEVQEKGIMTDEFYNIKDDLLVCAKCESDLPLALTPEKICKTMCTYPDSTNRNEDVLLRTLSTSHMVPCSQYNDSIADNQKSQSVFHSMSTTMQNCKNDELKNTNITMHTPIATKPFTNTSPISETSASFQSMDCTRKDFYSNDLLAKHSLSIKKLKKQMRLLKDQIKKFKRLKEKPNTNSCHCMSYNDSILLNSNLFAIICKGIAEYFDGKEKTSSKNVRDIDSEKNKKVKLKKRRLNKNNEDKNIFLWKVEDCDERYPQDKLYNESEGTMKATACDILQSKCKLCTNKSNVHINASSKFLNNIDDCDKREFIFCQENASNTVKETSVEDDPTTSHSSTDKLYDSIEKISNNSLSRDNMKSIDIDYQTKMEMKIPSCNSDISIDDADNKFADIIPEENKRKRKNENKTKYSDRLFKKIRNLKRKVQPNLHVNKAENIEFDYYKPMKKLRIAHTPKTSVLQSNIDQENLTHYTIKSISNLEASQQEESNQQLNAQILKDDLLTENKEGCTKKIVSKECDERSDEADEYSETNNIDDKRSIREIHEENLVLMNSKSCLQDNNFSLPVMDIECASTVSEFNNKRDDISVQDTSKESIAMKKISIETSNNCDELDILRNVSDNTSKDLKLEKSIPLKTQVTIQSESSVFCKNSKYDTYKFTENLQVKAIDDITTKGSTPNVELEYICNTTGDESCNNHEIPNNVDTNEKSLSNQSILIEATGHESRNNYDVSNEVSEIQYLQRDSEIIAANGIDNGVDESALEVKNTLGQQGEVYTNDKINEMQLIERENVCVNQQEKDTKFFNHVSYDDDEQFQTPMSVLTKYINIKYINCKPMRQKKMTYNCKIIDRFVKKQLNRLINSAWENDVHYDVIQKLTNTCGPRIIAKCIVEVLLEDDKHNEALDKSFTPPAPLMRTFEQKLTALLIDLEVSKPTVLHFVQIAIEYKLFKLNRTVKTQSIGSLTRMYLALSRIQKDREKVRIMCCNALYCMNLMSINILYTVFTSWPEVFPNAEINREILPTCIAFLIGSQRIQGTPSKLLLNKLIALKTLISTFYKYPYTKQAQQDIVKELMTLLKAKRTNGLDTAIILFAKREGSSWTYKNIIQSALLPMIINYEHPCIYSAFSLLGKLMRAFPIEDTDNIVQDISEQLCDLIQSGQGTHDQQEGIITALLSLSRQKFDVVAPSIIKWTPNKPLRPTVLAQLQAFINTYSRKYWKNYLQRIESK
ncbi:uncharacterized protein [Anoplolepis gracilipes]|uniref:uncharacterized protein isoform X2 n=1 Tax=Anoplolepis gracilipes TaxID=354296 RepID=UPI003BA2C0CF